MVSFSAIIISLTYWAFESFVDIHIPLRVLIETIDGVFYVFPSEHYKGPP